MRFLGLTDRARVYLGEIPFVTDCICRRRFDGETATEVIGVYYENQKVSSEVCGTFTDDDGLVFELERHMLHDGRTVTETVEARVTPDGAEVAIMVLQNETGDVIAESDWNLPRPKHEAVHAA